MVEFNQTEDQEDHLSGEREKGRLLGDINFSPIPANLVTGAGLYCLTKVQISTLYCSKLGLNWEVLKAP